MASIDDAKNGMEVYADFIPVSTGHALQCRSTLLGDFVRGQIIIQIQTAEMGIKWITQELLVEQQCRVLS